VHYEKQVMVEFNFHVNFMLLFLVYDLNIMGYFHLFFVILENEVYNFMIDRMKRNCLFRGFC